MTRQLFYWVWPKILQNHLDTRFLSIGTTTKFNEGNKVVPSGLLMHGRGDSSGCHGSSLEDLRVEVIGNEWQELAVTLAYFSRFELRVTLPRIAVIFVEIINALNIVSKCGSLIGDLTAMHLVLLSRMVHM